MTDIPEFLLVKNRVPLAPALAAKVAAIQAQYVESDRVRWGQMQEAIKTERARLAKEQREATKARAAEAERNAKHRERHPDRVERSLIRRGLLTAVLLLGLLPAAAAALTCVSACDQYGCVTVCV